MKITDLKLGMPVMIETIQGNKFIGFVRMIIKKFFSAKIKVSISPDKFNKYDFLTFYEFEIKDITLIEGEY